mgnify:CR=1 FL=1
MVPFDSLSKTALEINLFGIARLDSTRLPYMVTLVTIYGNRCMGGRERSSEDHVIGVVFDEESHGNIRFYSFGRRYTVLKQTPRVALPFRLYAFRFLVRARLRLFALTPHV